jgi:predicted  nucleic acid-binding Zn-ribbon protein
MALTKDQILNLIYHAEDKLYAKEDLQGEIQERIEEYEKKNRNTDTLENKFARVSKEIEVIEDKISSLQEQLD